jgi:hypothetical protein
MEIAALSGLLGLGYLISKVSGKKEGFNGGLAKNTKAAGMIPPVAAAGHSARPSTGILHLQINIALFMLGLCFLEMAQLA